MSKIKAGIIAYVKSSVSPSAELELLKASILHALGADFLTHKYEYADESTKQIIKPSYFEEVSPYLALDETELISQTQILRYLQLAQTYTKRYLGYFYKKYNSETAMEDVYIYCGSGNKHYYKSRSKAKPDRLSVFASLGTPHPYYESHVLTS